MTERNTEAAESADELIDHLRQRDGWLVDDYSLTIEEGDPANLTLTLEHRPGSPVQHRKDVLDAVQEITDLNPDDPGAHIDNVIAKVAVDDGNELDKPELRSVVHKLKMKGDVYEPQNGYIRVI